MANSVQKEDIIKMNELYLELKTYAAVARKVGFSPSTVKKYIILNYVSQREQEKNKKIFNLQVPTAIEVSNMETWSSPDYSKLFDLTQQELEGCDELRKEFSI